MTKAIILMAYGSPTRMDDLLSYLKGIYEGREVPEYAMEENTKKYSLVDGTSPSNSIIDNLVEKFQAVMKKDGDFIVYLGNKHWHPFLGDTINKMNGKDIDQIVAVPLFPFPSRNVEMSYRLPLEESLKKAARKTKVSFINGLDGEEMFLNSWIEILSQYAVDYGQDSSFLFTAHSLPLFTSEETEYKNSFFSFVENLSKRLNIRKYYTAFQSQGKYGSRWLKPDLSEVFSKMKNDGLKKLIAVPVGFIYDHLEILYDLDLEFGERVKEEGYEYVRTRLPNYGATFILSLRNIVLNVIGSEQINSE